MSWLDRLKNSMRIYGINPEMATDKERGWSVIVKNVDTTNFITRIFRVEEIFAIFANLDFARTRKRLIKIVHGTHGLRDDDKGYEDG